jgi:hypothetical protein
MTADTRFEGDDRQPLEGVRLDAIDLGLNLCNFLRGSWRKRYAKVLRPHCSAAEHGGRHPSPDRAVWFKAARLRFSHSPDTPTANTATRLHAWEPRATPAVRGSVPHLIRLNRYERQAWSRLEKAIHQFMIIKLKSSLTRAATQTNDQRRSF